MSWATCYSGSNNIHYDLPPIMSDGRNYASWQPGAVLNKKIKNQAGIKSNWQYRKYLTDNADNIIRYNQNIACGESQSCPMNTLNVNNSNTNTTPYLYSSCNNKEQPYGYNNTDLKNIYIKKNDLQSRLVTPVLTQEHLLQNRYQNYN